MTERIDTPAEVHDWKQRMARVAHAHHVAIPEGFDVTTPTMGPQARDLMHLLASHADGYHGQHVPDDHTLNGALQEWLLAVDPLHVSPPSRLVQPVPAGYGMHLIAGEHPTAGLPGFPAYDFGAPAGTPVVACEHGVITKLSGHDPNLAPTEGVHGPFGWSVYLQGDSGSTYYMTHLGSRLVAVGAHVTVGERLGTIGNYARWGGANHVHMGVHPGGPGSPSIATVIAAPLFIL